MTDVEAMDARMALAATTWLQYKNCAPFFEKAAEHDPAAGDVEGMNDTDAILERADAMGKAWAESRNRIGLAGVMGEQYVAPAPKQTAERMQDDLKSKRWGDGMMTLMTDGFDGRQAAREKWAEETGWQLEDMMINIAHLERELRRVRWLAAIALGIAIAGWILVVWP